ncbi:MAG: D-aminoacylase [Acidobacteriota bacterium]|nr:D-aminoacylase [Acidobacteriota bacterium]
MRYVLALVLAGVTGVTAQQPRFDIVIKGGLVYDGTGGAPVRADVGITGDQIAAIAPSLPTAGAGTVIDASGLAVSPGFINMLSWAVDALIVDGRSQSDIRQGVTTEIFGEGASMGPLNDEMRARWTREQGEIKYPITWTTLSEYLQFLEKKGVSPNVASFIGAATIREHVIGLEDRKPTAWELELMQELVREQMKDGALGIGSSLIYAPGFYASTEELIALARAAGEYQGKYISHMRSEGNRLEEAVTELIRISREAGVPAEIYHLKAAGKSNWPKMARVLEMVEAARAEGLKITADMYMYPAGATGLDAALPPSALSGGWDALYARIRNPEEREKIRKAIITPTDEWENLYLAAGSPEQVLLVEFRNEKLRHLTGRTLASVAAERKRTPEDTILDLILEDQSRVGTVYFLMSEENIATQLRKPWVSLGSDGGSMAPEGVFLQSNPHPRAYGNFSRLLGKYVREDKVITLEDAVRRMSGLPAENLGLDRRGLLKKGHFADIAIFDPATVGDRATFDKPHQYSIGMKHVLVNGTIVLKDGEHTGATPGRALKGPGAKAQRPGDQLWNALAAMCGKAFEGKMVEGTEPGDKDMTGQRMVMHVRSCTADELRIPFFVGGNRSRTWVITRTPAGLRLKHDHRHEDGSEDKVTQYGGDTRVADGLSLDFHADEHTAKLLPASASNIWTIAVAPGKTFSYALRRETSGRRFRVEFDLAKAIPAPPAPW